MKRPNELMSDPAFRSAFSAALLAATLSAGGMAYAAAHAGKSLSAMLAALFAVTIALAATCVVRRILKSQADDASEIGPRVALRMMSSLSAVAYAWAAAVLFLVYVGSGLTWRHGWQYGSFFAVIACALISYVRDLQHSDHPAGTQAAIAASFFLAAVHGAAAAAVAVWIVLAGKLDTAKGDWAANHVFLAGAVALAVLGGLSVIVQKALKTNASLR